MQAVERAYAEFWAVAAGKICAEIKGLLRNPDFQPQSCSFVSFKLSMHLLRFRGRQVSAEDVLPDGVRPFSVVKRSEPHAWS